MRTTRRRGQSLAQHSADRDHHAAAAPSHLKQEPTNGLRTRGALSRALRTAWDYLPRGNTLDDTAFRQRHLLLCWILGLHVPALFAFGVWQGFGVVHAALEVTVPAVCLLLARLARNRRLAGFFVTAGLVFCSSVLVHLSGGTIEAHFHFFVLIGLIALYQDWVPFLWNVVFTVVSHGLGSAIGADLIFNHFAAQNRPWSWAMIHGAAVLAACVGVIIFWKNTEIEQRRSSALAAELADAELSAAQAEAAQRQSVSELFVNLARRNQSLLDRQLGLIAELEQRERAPEALSELFQLDHLATRIRRNAESLLVLSGDEPPRRWGRPVPVGEVVRAAAAEVEDYWRVEVLVNDYLEVAGRVVADLAHLLAELIENATTFSPPASEVRVRSHLAPAEGSTYVLSVEDTGIGMPENELKAANELLANPPEFDLRRSSLGFHVVGRLAKRYGLHVRLANTPGGGITALITLPDDIVSERRLPAPTGANAARVGTPLGPAAPSGGWPASMPEGATVATPPWILADPTRRPVALPLERTNGRQVVQAAGLLATPPGPAARTPGPETSGPGELPAPGPGAGDPADAPPADSLPARLPAGPGPVEASVAAPLPPAPLPAPAPAPPPGYPMPPAGGAPPAPLPAPAPTLTAEGLVRRVPGAGLAPALRRSGAAGGPSPSAAGDPAAGSAPAGRDPQRVRSMLSRFQASQRAGRAAAEAPTETMTVEDER